MDFLQHYWLNLIDFTELFARKSSNSSFKTNRTGIYDRISMLNHACDENCGRFCINDTMVIYSVREI